MSDDGIFFPLYTCLRMTKKVFGVLIWGLQINSRICQGDRSTNIKPASNKDRLVNQCDVIESEEEGDFHFKREISLRKR